MSLRRKIILYLSFFIGLIALLLLIWAYDTGRLAIKASPEQGEILTAQELKKLPSPDESTFAKIFGFFLKPFVK